jgi:ABC-type amino acid transport substrate-binding protein
MLAVAGGVAGIYQTLLIPAARSELVVELDALKQQVLNETKQHEATQTSLRDQIAKLEKVRSDLLEPSASAILLSPKNDEIVIGTYIVFQWEYKNQQTPNFIIEIARLGDQGLQRKSYSVVQPQDRVFHLPIADEKDVGQYLWRVRPGRVSENHEVATGPWSAYQSFWAFTSVKQKIAHMRTMIVGMYPSFSDKFNLPVAGGKYEGLSVDLANFLANELSTRLPMLKSETTKDIRATNKDIRVEIVSFRWQDLLSKVADNTVDMAISSITASNKRERDFDVMFSSGYYITHQMFLGNQLKYDERLPLFDNIGHKRIGVVKGTTNERAAYYIATKCNCGIDVKATYQEFIESKNALFKKEIDLLLTDDIWVTGESNLPTFKQYGPRLDTLLSEFYSNEYGRSREEYAIAFSNKGGDEIMHVVNEILESEKAQRFIASVEAKAKGNETLPSAGSDKSMNAKANLQ